MNGGFDHSPAQSMPNDFDFIKLKHELCDHIVIDMCILIRDSPDLALINESSPALVNLRGKAQQLRHIRQKVDELMLVYKSTK